MIYEIKSKVNTEKMKKKPKSPFSSHKENKTYPHTTKNGFGVVASIYGRK